MELVELDFSKSVVNKEKFHFLDYVDYATLENYFNDAFCFVYPSLNEGFGYPPIQAMKYGTPVIASAISSIPEVCQNAVCYFNPFSMERTPEQGRSDEFRSSIITAC